MNIMKTIIFDWGGVLTNGTHTSSIISYLEERYGVRIDGRFFNDLMKAIDDGSMPFEEFIDKFNLQHDQHMNVPEMQHVFGSAINPNEDVISLAKELKSKCRVIMLSNNNKPTVELLRTFHKEMLDIFDKTYFSCEIHMRKPSKESFEFVLNDIGVDGSECVFIDDKEKNIKAAESIGIKGILFESTERFKEELDRLID